MKRFARFILSAFGLTNGHAQKLLSPGEFTRDFAEALREAAPHVGIEIVNDLELKVTTPDGRDSTAFLGNAYDTYRQSPEHLADIIQRYSAACAESTTLAETIDRTRIVPVIKDRGWLEEARQLGLARGAEGKAPVNVIEDYNDDLVIVYAEDSPKNIRYFGPDDLAAAGVDRSELRALAVENLKRIVTVGRLGGDGVYMFTAGGDYEASLILFDHLWTSGNLEVKGEIVVAIPTRDLIMVTGSDDDSVEKMKQMAADAWSQGSYRLTPKLFVYRNARFETFDDNKDC